MEEEETEEKAESEVVAKIEGEGAEVATELDEKEGEKLEELEPDKKLEETETDEKLEAQVEETQRDDKRERRRCEKTNKLMEVRRREFFMNTLFGNKNCSKRSKWFQ